MQQPPKPNAFTLSARSNIAIDLQRRANNAHEPKPEWFYSSTKEAKK